MLNKIENWSYEKPTEEGYYLVCWGDVETPENVHTVYLAVDAVDVLSCYTSSHRRVWRGTFNQYYSNNSYKFARLLFSLSEIEDAESKGDL